MNENSGSRKRSATFTVKNIIIVIVFLAVLAGMISLFFGESGKRAIKSWQSEHGGGLDRTLTVYDYNGNEIRSWTGRFDISDDTDVVSFDLDGKRTIIKGGIVIVQEN